MSQKALPKKLIPADARLHNRAVLLGALLHRGRMSRSDLSKQTGITKATVSDLIAGLIDDGLVIERGTREAAKPGRPATLLEFHSSHAYVLAMDLSSHRSFRGALLNLDSSVEIERNLDLHGAVGEDALAAVSRLLAELESLADRQVIGISIGTPGLVLDYGHQVDAPALDWNSVDLHRHIAEISTLPLLIANDANLAAIAEQRFGGGDDDLLLVRIGRGVGAGLLIGGRLREGAHSIAGEIGHVTVGDGVGPLCPCGRTGCLESWVAIPRLAEALDPTRPEKDRRQDLATAGKRLAMVLTPVITAVDTNEVVLSGPVDILDGAFIDAVRDTVRARTLRGLHPDIPVRLATADETAVLRGAAALMVERELRIS